MHTGSRTGQRLHDDHHRVIDRLNALEAYLDTSAEDRPPTLGAPEERAWLTALEQELGGALDRHFAVEEEALFPPLAVAGGHELTADLLADHERIRPLARRLGRLCALALREGFDAESWPVFRGFGWALIDALVLHIQKEETTLLAAVDALLPPAEDAALAEAMRSSGSL